MTREPSLWDLQRAENPGHSKWYIERFRALEETGQDLVGEARLIDAMAPREGRILDAGCGFGRHAAWLHAQGHAVVGVDGDDELIADARALRPGATWLVQDLSELDLPSVGVTEPFDVILCAGNVVTFVAPSTRIEVLRRIRTRSDAYVVMVTARTEETDRLIGLSVGADDYISKPFSPRELVARVKALQRRPRIAATNTSTTQFGELAIDAERREVLVGDQPVELSALEFDLLATLTGAPGRVFSRRQLIDRVWGSDFYGDERVVDVHIRNLRRALGDDADAPRWVGTVRGVGYKSLVAPS